MIRVTVWGENVHEQTNQTVKALYPNGMHTVIAEGLAEDPELETRTATLQEPEHGLTQEVLDNTDVLTWWGHCAHGKVEDAIVDRVQKRVLEGMGLLVLHSGHYSKIFKRLMGTTCSLTWREAGEKERLWVCNPGHPIVQGLGPYFELPNTEMYGEPFGVPTADETIFISWFEGGEVFRSGLVYRRGNGKIFYFRPGHETYPIYFNKDVKLVLKNAVKWARPEGSIWKDSAPNIPVEKAPEKIQIKGGKLHEEGEAGFK
ncbi:MAG: ThuA domain-containing protein [Verrucomicrobia bacterium]|nr:ThuA domain-containing protein [Verrucomicrobiota bacterium]MCH8512092.1 ThuA domain-containing protein [Kiritimatiellia bacterium]